MITLPEKKTFILLDVIVSVVENRHGCKVSDILESIAVQYVMELEKLEQPIIVELCMKLIAQERICGFEYKVPGLSGPNLVLFPIGTDLKMISAEEVQAKEVVES